MRSRNTCFELLARLDVERVLAAARTASRATSGARTARSRRRRGRAGSRSSSSAGAPAARARSPASRSRPPVASSMRSVQIGDGDARRALEADAALAGERQRVQLERADVRLAQHQLEQRPDLVVVQPRRHRRQDRRGDVVLLEQVERLELGLHGVGAEQDAGRSRAGTCRATARCARRAPPACARTPRRAACRPLVEIVSRRMPASRHISQELGQLRVQRRLAAGEVDDVELVVVLGEVRRGSRACPRRTCWCARVVLVDRVADRAVEVARGGDGDDRQVDLLLVRRAGAAVEAGSRR